MIIRIFEYLTKENPILGLFLVVALVLRAVGVGYGTPLWVVADEPSLIFGALKMMELKTVLPVLHDEAFRGLLYYTPYLSYLYLIPFGAITAIKCLFFEGTFSQFKSLLQVDLSAFFIAARLVSVAAGTATVALVYASAERIFKSRQAAHFAGLIMAVGTLPVLFSHWARHWTAATFMFALIIYIISSDKIPQKRYPLAALIAGIGMGISLQVGLTTLFIAAWFLWYDKISLTTSVKQWWFWKSILIFIVLTVVAYILWPRGFYVAAGAPVAVANHKTITGFINSYTFYFTDFWQREPGVLTAVIAGCIFGFARLRRFTILTAGFILLYIALFYFLFVNASRFMMLMYPLVAVLAGYGLAEIFTYASSRSRWVGWVAAVVMLVPSIITTLYLDWLLIKGDTRIMALEWIEKEVPAGSKIVVLSPLLRLPTTPAALQEQESIDAASLRSTDRAEAELTATPWAKTRWHALNLNAVSSSTFFSRLPTYAQSHGYEYVVMTPEFAKDKGGTSQWPSANVEQVAFFEGYKGNPIGHLPTDGTINLRTLFSSKRLGPNIMVMKINP